MLVLEKYLEDTEDHPDLMENLLSNNLWNQIRVYCRAAPTRSSCIQCQSCQIIRSCDSEISQSIANCAVCPGKWASSVFVDNKFTTGTIATTLRKIHPITTIPIERTFKVLFQLVVPSNQKSVSSQDYTLVKQRMDWNELSSTLDGKNMEMVKDYIFCAKFINAINSYWM